MEKVLPCHRPLRVFFQGSDKALDERIGRGVKGGYVMGKAGEAVEINRLAGGESMGNPIGGRVRALADDLMKKFGGNDVWLRRRYLVGDPPPQVPNPVHNAISRGQSKV
ncbi:unnamed protein product [Pararhodospirillum photometricum DSM 122]|uniref:Uncharacterized protein n=1 Tax=Pararhodospirillum photometricum DSM 122 TaxID=1150469 RepID=H6SPL7_PARPM|nr:unnamed protein product [Pararhodospirillum photometricum DSM 122]